LIAQTAGPARRAVAFKSIGETNASRAGTALIDRAKIIHIFTVNAHKVVVTFAHKRVDQVNTSGVVFAGRTGTFVDINVTIGAGETDSANTFIVGGAAVCTW
jgi:hypothetical protein